MQSQRHVRHRSNDRPSDTEAAQSYQRSENVHIQGVYTYRCGKSMVKLRFTVTTIYVGAGKAQSCFPRGDQPGLDVLGGWVSIEESELAGTQSPRWPRGQANKRHSPSEVQCQRLLAGPPATSAPHPAPKDSIKTHHNRGVFPHRGFDTRKTYWGVRTITRTTYQMIGRAFCVWTGASKHYAMKCDVAGGLGGPGGMEVKTQVLYARTVHRLEVPRR